VLLCDEGLALARDVGEPFALGLALNNLGRVLLHRGDRVRGDFHRAAAVAEEGLRHGVATGNTLGVGHFLEMSGLVRCAQGDPVEAETLFLQSLNRFREIGATWDTGVALRSLGQAAYQRRDLTGATAYCAESLATWWDIGNAWGIPQAIEMLARVAMAQAAPEHGVRLFAAAAAARQAIGTPSAPADVAEDERRLAIARGALGEPAFVDAWADGWNMPLERAIQSALADTPSAPDTRDEMSHTPDDMSRPSLTRREREVAVLVARGLTNRQVAAELVIALRTAEAHVEHILDKLGLTSRTQVATWVVGQGWLAHPAT
jgi:DNA-binding NarL/FixJ family response regulator